MTLVRDFEETITNELGNKVTLSCKQMEKQLNPEVFMYTLSAVGPNSSTTWEITEMELDTLFDQFYLHR